MPHRSSGGLGTTTAPPRRPERTLAVALIAIVAFNQPLLRLFDLGAKSTIAGLPAIYVYLFAAWALVIALLAAAIEMTSRNTPNIERGELAAVGETAEPSAPADAPRRARAMAPSGDPAAR